MKLSILSLASILAIATSEGNVRGRQLSSDSSNDNDDDNDDDSDDTNRCNNPERAVLDLLECVGNNDAVCAAAAYDPGFQRFHNEVFTGAIAVADPAFWAGAFTLFPTFAFDIRFSRNVGKNRASVRYIETVTSTDGSVFGLPPSSIFPFGQSVVQHEHALIEVDNDCKLLKWEQYGDNKEQTDVDVITGGLICFLDPTTPGCAGGGI